VWADRHSNPCIQRMAECVVAAGRHHLRTGDL
jgi:hypothetical protein